MARGFRYHSTTRSTRRGCRRSRARRERHFKCGESRPIALKWRKTGGFQRCNVEARRTPKWVFARVDARRRDKGALRASQGKIWACRFQQAPGQPEDCTSNAILRAEVIQFHCRVAAAAQGGRNAHPDRADIRIGKLSCDHKRCSALTLGGACHPRATPPRYPQPAETSREAVRKLFRGILLEKLHGQDSRERARSLAIRVFAAFPKCRRYVPEVSSGLFPKGRTGVPEGSMSCSR